MRTIKTHDDTFNVGQYELMAEYGTKLGSGRPPDTAQVSGVLTAYINHGRWLVDCPSLDGGATLVSKKNPVFWCPYCGNDDNEGLWYKVVFPDDAGGIELELLKRPTSKQNWVAGETLRDLRAENAARGLGERRGA